MKPFIKFGFHLLLAGFALCFIIFLYYNFIHVNVTTPAEVCINNLRKLDAAAKSFALKRGLTNGQAIHFPIDLKPFIKLNSEGNIQPCPSGGVYQISKIGETPTCSLGTTVTPAHVLPQ